jgi:hypothetical protein
MTTQAILAIAGGFAGTAGSIITAFSVNRILRELQFAHEALSVTIEGLATDQQPVAIFTGIKNRFKKAEVYGSVILWIGIGLLAVGFICQSLSSLV